MNKRMAAYYWKINKQIEYLLGYPEATDARDFIRLYESKFGKFPFRFARKHTEFGRVFGRNLSEEDAEWGRFRPADAPPSFEDQLKKTEAVLRKQEKWEAKQKSEDAGTEAPAATDLKMPFE